MRHVDLVVHDWAQGYTSWLATLESDHQVTLEAFRDKYAGGSHMDSTEIHAAADCPFEGDRSARLLMRVTPA